MRSGRAFRGSACGPPAGEGGGRVDGTTSRERGSGGSSESGADVFCPLNGGSRVLPVRRRATRDQSPSAAHAVSRYSRSLAGGSLGGTMEVRRRRARPQDGKHDADATSDQPRTIRRDEVSRDVRTGRLLLGGSILASVMRRERFQLVVRAETPHFDLRILETKILVRDLYTGCLVINDVTLVQVERMKLIASRNYQTPCM